MAAVRSEAVELLVLEVVRSLDHDAKIRVLKSIETMMEADQKPSDMKSWLDELAQLRDETRVKYGSLPFHGDIVEAMHEAREEGLE